jgi:hypothetical protein
MFLQGALPMPSDPPVMATVLLEKNEFIMDCVNKNSAIKMGSDE